jgi:N-acetylneuraminate synthase/N,N'-diacetyllegionaminate synthase
VAHFGDPDKADTLVDLAADAGADVFKTQAFVTDTLVSSHLEEWRDRLRPKEVSLEFLRRMKDRCDGRGIVFMCTAHDEKALEWVDDLDVPAYKIGSGERGNTPYLREIAKRGKPVILSTGMYGEEDIGVALGAFADAGCRELAILHCITSYPTPFDQVNLRAMERIREIFPGPVGYSDHTKGGHAALAAVALGADVIEKHIALDFDVPNAQDWKVSAGPDDLSDLIRRLREVEAMLGEGRIKVQDCERPALNWALKSLVATRDLPAGTVLEPDMVAAKRPGGGLPPSDMDSILGRRLTFAVSADQAITKDGLGS